MEIKEMYYYEDEKRETYKETGFCEEIKEIILSYIQNYKQSDINDEKRNIINKIQTHKQFNNYPIPKRMLCIACASPTVRPSPSISPFSLPCSIR